MRVFKYLFPILIVGFIIFNSFSISNIKFDDSEIEVEVKGEVLEEKVYKLNKGSTFNDLLPLIELKDNADISNYSLQEPLYNKQVIVISNNEIKKISINTATVEELCSLSGIGIKTAKLIIEYRENNNGFKYLEELMNIKGIGEKKFAKIKDQISL